MKKKCVIFLLLILCFGCLKQEEQKTSGVMYCWNNMYNKGEINDTEQIGYYVQAYVINNDIVLREVCVKYLIHAYFENYTNISLDKGLNYLRNQSVFNNQYDHPAYSSIMPYSDGEYIIYPYLVKDYTDLSYYSKEEIPSSVRSLDGKRILFEKYYEYLVENHELDGYTCELHREDTKELEE